MSITQTVFGTTADGEEAYLYRLENSSGAYVTVTSYGCRIVNICVPDRDGKLVDVCLGFDTLAEYESDAENHGAVVGRVANRIGAGTFTLDGETYHVAINNGPNHLHGGVRGFHYYNWDSEIDGEKLRLTRVSPDGEEGYPGTLTMNVEYRWSEDNELSIVYFATTDAKTIFNTTNHTYFNLSGEDADTVLDHLLTIHADQFTEADENVLTTGAILEVAGTPFDFTEEKAIGADLPSDHYQLAYTKAYDHNFVLEGEDMREVAILYSPVSGICMTCTSDQPGMQLYVPAKSPAAHGKGGHSYPAFGSVCLETQGFPDAINKPNFPSMVLTPDAPFISMTSYRFTVR